MDSRELALRAFERQDTFFDNLNEATVQSGTLAIRSTFLLNGGACLALLAFAANTLTADALGEGQARLVVQILGSLSVFAWGAFLSVVATGLGYLANRIAVEAHYRKTRHWEAPFMRQSVASSRLFKATNILQIVTILTTVAALILFLSGLLIVARNIPVV
jgi:hypothetical protein